MSALQSPHNTLNLSSYKVYTPRPFKIENSHQTNIEGVFSCGDNTTRMRTVANAASMGTTTGIIINNSLIAESF
jgi:thioredoxin reductase